MPTQDIYNFLKISDTIATAGQPTEAEFSAIKDSGYQVVVNLALPESKNALPNEKAVVESHGMQYVHIPVIWDHPTLEDFQNFVSVLENNPNKSIFVHCAMNMRVSAFMYLYRLIYLHMSDEEAKKDLEKIWEPNDTWQRFIAQVIKYYK